MVNFVFKKTQLAGGDEIFFDHCAWMVSDMERGAAAFERLGFVLTPYSVHGNRDANTGELTRQGTANRLAMLQTGYVELLTDVKDMDNALTANFRAAVSRYEGVHLLAFGIEDAKANYVRITAAGIPLQPPVNLRREVEAADGRTAVVGFTVLRPAFEAFPEGRMQLLKHLTPAHMWQDRYVARANGITGLYRAVVCVADPVESASRLGRLLGIAPTPGEDGDVHVACARGGISFVSPATLERAVPGAALPSLPFIAAIGFVSHDLGKVRDFMIDAGVVFFDEPHRLTIPAHEALGTAMIVQAV